MPYRNIVIEKEAKLSLRNRQLRIQNEAIDTTVPIEDIDTVLIENRMSTVSIALLGALAKSGVAVFICDEFYMPCAVLEPYLQHSRQHEVTQHQLALSTPTKKQLWKQIITAKIRNQAKCLSLCGYTEAAKGLERIAKTVRSGDEGHAEGYAAAQYFYALFGKGFTRGDDIDIRNAWLNYGYSIVRGCVARTLAVYGLYSLFGVHHHSSLNQFNLADDFIEPFRPLVDLFTAQEATLDSGLSPAIKRQLLNLVNYDIQIDGKKYALTYAIERTVQSFSAICMGKGRVLLLPELVALKQHTYE